MRQSEVFIIKELIRQELLNSRDMRIGNDSLNQMEKINNVKLYTQEKDDGNPNSYKIGGSSNSRIAG